MLEEIRIRGLGVIDDAVLELAPGLTVITGETGAGKTMVVTGLGLLFGGRADSGVVRIGVDRALVEGRLQVAADDPATERALEAGAELDDGALLLARSLTGEGRSRAYVGGRAVPASLLADLAETNLAVHGQSDQSRLLRPTHQRDALDRYAGSPVATPLAAYTEAFAELRTLDIELGELTTRSRERAQEADLLHFGLEEIEALDPQPGEETALAAEEDRLANADMLRTAAAGAHDALLGAGDGPEGADAAALVAAAQSTLTAAGAHDEALAALAGRVSEIGYLLTDVAGDLASYAAGIDVDPARLVAVGDRRAALTRLIRKYGDDGRHRRRGARVVAAGRRARDDSGHRRRSHHRVDGPSRRARRHADGDRRRPCPRPAPRRRSGSPPPCRASCPPWPCPTHTCWSR